MEPGSTSTSVCLLTRSQTWFSASVVLDTLSPFNTKILDTFPVPSTNTVNIRTWLGKGPCTHNMGASADLYFTHGEAVYPTFTWPSVSPKGSRAYTTPVMRRIVADENTAIFCLDVSAAVPVAPELFDKAPYEFDEPMKVLLEKALNKVRDIINSLVGAYALYQYALVWEYMDERHQWMILDLNTKAAKGRFEQRQMDNWVPFKLDAHTKISDDGMLRDGVTTRMAELLKDEFREPFVFLKDSMWHRDIRTRFLLQFWILEYFAEKYSHRTGSSKAIRTFIQALDKVVAEQFQEFSKYFKSRKGELIRPTLAEKLRACFHVLRIKYDDKLFKRAKAVRDSLSHAARFDEDELREMELYVRELVRHVLRRDLELNGIFLSEDETSPMPNVQEIVPAYPERTKRLTKSFGPLQVN